MADSESSSWKVVHRNGRATVLKDPTPGAHSSFVVIDDSDDRNHVYEHFTAYRFVTEKDAIEHAAACALNGLEGRVGNALADFDHSVPDAAERLAAVLDILKGAARKHDDGEGGRE